MPNRTKADVVLALKRDDVGASEIAHRIGIGRASVYTIIEDKDAARVATANYGRFGSWVVAVTKAQ